MRTEQIVEGRMELTTKPAKAPVEPQAQAATNVTMPSLDIQADERLPHYGLALAELALQGACRSLLEFGSGDGRRLKAIGDYVTKESEAAVELTGIEADGGQQLDALAKGSADLVFTLSALAHQEDPEPVLAKLLKVTRRFAAFLEPVDADGKKGRLQVIAGEGSGDDQAPPSIHLHDYDALLRGEGVQPCLVMPLPMQLNGAGPLCRLFVIDKAAPDARIDAAALRERLFEAVTLQLLGNFAISHTEGRKLKYQVSKARDQLSRARIKGEHSVRSQLPHQAGEVLLDHMKRPYMLPILPWSLYSTYKKVRSGAASGGGRAKADAAPIKSVVKRSPVTGLDELVLPRVGDTLLAAIRTSYNETYQRELGVTQGRGFFRDADWRRINYAVNLLPKDAKSALDVGVGAGVLLNYLTMAERFDRVIGIDIDRHFNFLSLSNDVDWRQMDACNMSFPDNHFDIVFCMEVLEHLDDQQFEKALAELRRVTRRRLVASVPFDEPLPLPSFHKQHFTKSRIESVFPTASVTLLHKQAPKKADDGNTSRICPWALMVEDQA
jgi:SAM-dependent methyltransferase